MLPDTERLLRDRGSELVFGLVAPVGADLTWLEERLATLLRLYGYTPQHIRLSELLKKIPDIAQDLRDDPEVDRINTFMDGGNKLRDRAKAGRSWLFGPSQRCIRSEARSIPQAQTEHFGPLTSCAQSSIPTKHGRYVQFTDPASF